MERSQSRSRPSGLTISTVIPSPRPNGTLSVPPPSPGPGLTTTPQGTSTIRRSCSSQRCTSPIPSSVSVPASSPRPASPCTSPASIGSRAKSPRSTLDISNTEALPSSFSGSKTPGKPMSMETYFRLLKKSQVLDQLLSMNSYLHSSEEQLRKLQHEKAKSDSVQQRVFQELEKFQKQYVDVQRFFLELVEEMTVLCVKEEQLQLGCGVESALKHAKQVSEERALQDLQNATLSMGSKRVNDSAYSLSSASPVSSSSSSASSASSSSLESQALMAVGCARIKQMTQICADYEQQLVRNEEELTQAIHSTFTEECLARIAQFKAQEREHAAEKAATLERVEFLTRQNGDLKLQISDAQEAHTELQSDTTRLRNQLASQELTIQQVCP